MLENIKARLLRWLSPRGIDRHYIREMKDVEVTIDWDARELRFTGMKIIKANPTEEMWIKHQNRLAREHGSVHNAE